MKFSTLTILALCWCIAPGAEAQTCTLDPTLSNGCKIDEDILDDPFIAVCIADGVFEDDKTTLTGKGKVETKCLQSSEIDKLETVVGRRYERNLQAGHGTNGTIRGPSERGLKKKKKRKGSLLFDCSCCGTSASVPSGVDVKTTKDGECMPVADATQILDACSTTQGGNLSGSNGCGKGKGKGACDEVPACFEGSDEPVCVEPFASEKDLKKATMEAGVPEGTPIIEVLPSTGFQCGSNAPSASLAPSFVPSASPSTPLPSAAPSEVPTLSTAPSVAPTEIPSVAPSLSSAPSVASCEQPTFECGTGTDFFLVCLGEESDVPGVFNKFKSECVSTEELSELEATSSPTAAPTAGPGKGKGKGGKGGKGKGGTLLECGCCTESVVDANNGSATGEVDVLGKGKGKDPNAGDFCVDTITVRGRRLSRGGVRSTNRQVEW